MKRINGIQFRTATEAACHKVASALGTRVRITWTDSITTAAIDASGEMLLANVADNATVTDDLIWHYTGMYFHELLHRRYTTLWSDLHARTSPYLRALHNAVEDAWIETRAINEALVPNARELLARLLDGMCRDALAKVKDWSDPAQYVWVLAVYLRDHATIKMPLAAGLEPLFAEAKRRMAAAASTSDTFAIAKWLLAQLQKPEQPGKQPGQQPGNGKGQPGKGEGKGEGKGNGSEAGQNGAGGAQNAGEGDGKGSPSDAPVGPRKAVTATTHAVEVEPGAEPVGGGGAGGQFSEAQVLDGKQCHVASTAMRNINVDGAASARLRNEVKRLFDKSGREDWQVNRAAGRLNAGRLASTAAGNVNVFKRRSEVEGVDSAVAILLDVSGSMQNQRLDVAAQAVAAFCDTLRRANVKVQVWTFSHSVSLLKDWNEPTQRVTGLMARVRVAGSTNDYAALRVVHKQLFLRPEQRKVCFVMTDGCGDRRARGQVDAGTDLGITTVGIGIMTDVDHVYPQSVRIDKLADLGNASFKQIKVAL